MFSIDYFKVFRACRGVTMLIWKNYTDMWLPWISIQAKNWFNNLNFSWVINPGIRLVETVTGNSHVCLTKTKQKNLIDLLDLGITNHMQKINFKSFLLVVTLELGKSGKMRAFWKHFGQYWKKPFFLNTRFAMETQELKEFLFKISSKISSKKF